MPAVGSNNNGAFINQPHHFSGFVSAHTPNSLKCNLVGRDAFFLESATGPVLVWRTQASGRSSRSSNGSQISWPMMRYPSVASESSFELARNSLGSRRLPCLDTQINACPLARENTLG